MDFVERLSHEEQKKNGLMIVMHFEWGTSPDSVPGSPIDLQATS